MLDKILEYIGKYSTAKIITLTTSFVLAGSIPTVYFIAILFAVEYSTFLLFISIFLPLLLTPITIYIFIRLSTQLQYFKKHLAVEVDRNKQKDIILFEQARFVLMGEMMANISHQWKQPLNTVGIALFNLKNFEQEKKDAEKYYTLMEENISYLSQTIDDFLSFFDKRSHNELKSLDLISKEIKSIVMSSIKKQDIGLEIIIEEECMQIQVASSISQVIINLINNAVDALNKNKNGEIEVTFSVLKNHLCISCCDNGTGLDKAIEEKIFDPYFTTKSKSQGTGIGLYMSREIIEKIFEGTISLSNDARTCFEINLPYTDKCVQERK